MSRIGKMPIKLPAGVTVKLEAKKVTVQGKLGVLERTFFDETNIALENNVLTVTRSDDTKKVRALHGLTRALLNNMVVGVSTGFTKNLILHGVGYKMEVKGKYLVLNLGYSHPIYFQIPSGITIETTQPVNNTSELKMTGSDKELVGMLADKIRSFRKPEPYKGKGFRYKDEQIIKKAGKSAK